MNDKVEPFGHDDLRDAVVRLETTATHIADSVDKLSGVVERHVVKTGDQVRDLHGKIDSNRNRGEETLEKYVTKERHDSEMRSLRTVVKSIAGALTTLATAALAYVLFGKG